MKKAILLGITGLLFLTLAACSSNQPSTGSKATNSSSSALKDTKEASVIKEATVSVDDSIKLYQATYPNSDITALELEQTLGQPFYRIEGRDDQKEYELTIDAKTKAVSQQKEEALDGDDQGSTEREQEKLNLTNLISTKKAIRIAEQAAKGTATECELAKELTTTYWEVTVKEGTTEQTVKIDAQSGKVLEQETDD